MMPTAMWHINLDASELVTLEETWPVTMIDQLVQNLYWLKYWLQEEFNWNLARVIIC